MRSSLWSLVAVKRGGRMQGLLGGDDWLGAPLAVPEDVRDGEDQNIGEEVTYWYTHSGDIGVSTVKARIKYVHVKLKMRFRGGNGEGKVTMKTLVMINEA
eukprot:761852-Hanusia_phi.AAC.4